MDWEAIGAVGQMLGSIAVFVTLGYLSIQVRHARADMRRSISLTRAEGLRQLFLTQATDERLNRIRVQANKAYGWQMHPRAVELMQKAALTEEEVQAFISEENAWWHVRSHAIQYVDELSPGERAEFESRIPETFGKEAPPLNRIWYEATKSQLNPDVVRYIESHLAQSR
jgi:hypothetical protein